MEESKIVERPLMGEEEFKNYISSGVDLADRLNLISYEATSRFKSVRRAIKRGHVSIYGSVYPRRPFNNRANTSSRKNTHSRVFNERKKLIYDEFKKG